MHYMHYFFQDLAENTPHSQKSRPLASPVIDQERQKCALHHGNMSTKTMPCNTNLHEHVSNCLNMLLQQLCTEIHNIITIYIHYRSIYFKIIICIILVLVILNIFACKINSVNYLLAPMQLVSATA